MSSARNLLIVVLIVTLGIVLACANKEAQMDPGASDAGKTHAKVVGTAESVPYFAWVSPDVARGGQPKSEESFRELSEVGIVTIISVDGAKPDLEMAKRYGMRYVHIPFGYDGVPEEQRLQLAKTVRELEGPFFVHCHHGKHRGPAGAVIAQMALGGMDNAEAVAELKRAGTAGKYVGLYAVAETYASPDAEATTTFIYDFPNVATVEELPEAMAVIDRRFDGMILVKKAGWKAPSDHPDISPAHEALQLMELFVEIGRTDDAKSRPEDYATYLAQAESASRSLEAALREETPDTAKAEMEFAALKESCSACHTAYRN